MPSDGGQSQTCARGQKSHRDTRSSDHADGGVDDGGDGEACDVEQDSGDSGENEGVRCEPLCQLRDIGFTLRAPARKYENAQDVHQYREEGHGNDDKRSTIGGQKNRRGGQSDEEIRAR